MPPRKGKVAKKKTTKKSENVYTPKAEIDSILESRIPSSNNTLIYNSPLYRRYFQDKNPSDLVFVFYDDNPQSDPRNSSKTINGSTIQDIQAGTAGVPTSSEHAVTIKDHTFELTDKSKLKAKVVAVEYEGARYKVKYAGQNENGFPYFYIEYYKDLLYGGSENRYWGEFLTKIQNVSFGKKKKRSSLESDLEYLLKIK
jgi:hypothetical protein